ncbi:MAG: ATP-binding cassette domain-containing protein [Deltaproteobacteria bacterium]|nr:ATP-binding cassette domain-containing protein [Deltaproteobacteria bacterium]
MIQVEGLTKFYGNFHALKAVSFHVEKGEILGFLGPNGAGKTTTMRILTCFLPASGGSAKVANFDVFEEPLEVSRRIGYLPESVPLYKDMVSEDYLTFVAGIKGVPSKDIKMRVEKVMDDCGITHMRKKLVGQMSKGYRQRVGLAQALINDPEVLILDEPTIGLDPKQIVEIRNLIKNLAGRRTVILSTHILPEVSMTCQRVVIINEGRVVAVDTPQNLTSRVKGAKRIELKVEGAPENVLSAVRDVKGISSVELAKEGTPQTAAVNSFIVTFDMDADARRELAHRVVTKGFGLIEMRTIEMSLEDIFVKLVTKE